ncbi:hypothetical protein [Acinetobacter sp. MD2(2019)]|uniref:hypothetical protein n=1 Tax=Acinetobacter sp. MD2(2019) TaxID=2605273 RepID=UPI002D1F7C4B|nr:hypothetical protein [Acinetobacter sp. MD2(2019)]MEB3755140.1 hypothetical protein [Acinetobacter sp. MD2(2019)]
MKKLTQYALAAIMVSGGMNVAFAEEAARPGPGGNKWADCTTTSGCELEIPIKLVVAKKCEVTGGAPIELKSTGGNVSSKYTVTTNTPYILNISTANAGVQNSTFVQHNNDSSKKIPTTITTTGPKGSVSWGATNMDGSSSDNYTVTVSNNAVSATQLAGTYTDTYRVSVSY